MESHARGVVTLEVTLDQSESTDAMYRKLREIHIVTMNLIALYDEFEAGKQRVLVKHQGGHFLPSSDFFVRKYRKFLASFC